VPYIITQPERSQRLPYGSSWELSVEVYVPDDWVVRYQWVVGNGVDIPGATEATLRMSPGDPHYPNNSAYYICKIRVGVPYGEIYNLSTSYGSVYIDPPAQGDDTYYILTQPESQVFPHGADVVMNVEMHVADGWEVVGYYWERDKSGGSNPGVMGPVLRLPPSSRYYPPKPTKPYYSTYYSYRCMITVQDAHGTRFNIFSSQARATIEAEREINDWEQFWIDWDKFWSRAFETFLYLVLGAFIIFAGALSLVFVYPFHWLYSMLH